VSDRSVGDPVMAAPVTVTRMALMVYAPDGVSGPAFEGLLHDRRETLRGAAAEVGGTVRIGTREPRDPSRESRAELLAVDGAVELTAAEEDLMALSGRAAEIGAVLDSAVDLGRSRLMIGITHRIVAPPQEGEIFLSLAFRRQPGTSIEEFRSWWLQQHSAVATRHLLPELLAYDQVHVDRELSERASAAAGITFEPYDAYDNLTWATLESSIGSTSKPGSEREIYEDEIGHLDHSTYRGAVMRVLEG
jgi:hypothetical protein